MIKKIPLIIFLGVVTLTLSAQSAKVKNLQQQRKELQSDIDFTNELLKKKKTGVLDAEKHQHLLQGQIQSRKQLVALLNEDISGLDVKIIDKKQQISILEQNLNEKKTQYALSVQKMYRRQRNQNKLLFVLSADNFAQSYRRSKYLQRYAVWEKEKAGEIAENQQQIAQEKATLETQKTEKENLAGQKKKEEAQLTKEETTLRTEIAALNKDQKKLQAELAQKKKKADEINRRIDKIIADEIAASQKAAKEKNKEKRTADTKSGYAMTKEEKTLSTQFADNKGKLPFPIKGKYKIVEYFGLHAKSRYVTLGNPGIDIETTDGNEARAVFDGVVSAVNITEFPYMVFVRHGNYITIYSNMNNLFVKKGDKVKTGQSLGKIATTGNSTVLHFEIRKETSTLDPLPWLNR